MKDNIINKQIVNQRNDYYQTRNESCGKIVKIYDKKTHRLYDGNCKQLSCAHCRQIEIAKLMKKINNTACIYNLKRHLVITLKGKQYRDKINPDESFKDFSKKFDQLKKLLIRELFSEKTYYHYFENGEMVKKRLEYAKHTNFDFIGFRRAQENGYCHLHALLGTYIPYKKLKSACEKVGFGGIDIEHVDIQRIKHYLSKYWYKDHEWYIPKGMKHFTKSQSIDWVTDEKPIRELSHWEKNDNRYYRIDGRGNIEGLSEIDYYAMIIQNISGYPPPIELMLQKFISINPG